MKPIEQPGAATVTVITMRDGRHRYARVEWAEWEGRNRKTVTRFTHAYLTLTFLMQNAAGILSGGWAGLSHPPD